MAESVDRSIRRRKRESRYGGGWGMIERFMYYGPRSSFFGEIPPGVLRANDFVRINGKWSKIGKIDDDSLTTFRGETIRLKYPPEDFLYMTPSQLGGWLLAQGVATFLGLIAIAVAIYFGRR